MKRIAMEHLLRRVGFGLTCGGILALGLHAQGARGGSTGSGSGPSSGPEREVDVPASMLRFPRGMESFEEMSSERSVRHLEGWELFGGRQGLFRVCATDEVPGGAGRPGSTRWLHVTDLDLGSAKNGFCTNPILAPNPRNYRWSLHLELETLANGPAFPRLMSQHPGPDGFGDLFGIELHPGGIDLVVGTLGGDPARVRLADSAGAAAPGGWIDLELAVDFDRSRVSGAVNGGAPRYLPLHPRRGTRLEDLRFAYHGEGPGNGASLYLDDLAIAFGASTCEESFVIGFESEDDFATGLVNGQDISTPPEFGSLFAIHSAGPNAGAAIFDSTPGGPNDPSQDRDLLVGLGNLLILQNNNAASSLTQTNPGVFDRPNDDADGGSLFFSFTRPLEVLGLDLVDIDQGPVQRATVTLTDSAGKSRVYQVPNGWTEDLLIDGGTGYRTLDTTTLLAQPGFTSAATAVEDAGFQPAKVVLLAVQFGSSGALDNLELRLSCVQLDFETEDDGLSVLANGQDISTPPEFGAQVSISSSGPNAGAAIFDSTPGGPNDPSQDNDLLVGLGNLLILQNNNAAASLVQTVPGVFDRPNDDADGGTLLFTFPAPVEPRRLDLVDIDPGLPNSSSVVLTDDHGRTRRYSVPAGWTEDLIANGPSGFRTLDLRTLLPQVGFAAVATVSEDAGFDSGRVTQLRVNLGSSGAVDNLCFCP